MYNQKYTTTTTSKPAAGTNNSAAQHQSRINGTSSGATNQYLNNRSTVRGSSASSAYEKQLQNGGSGGHGNGSGGTNGGSSGPMRSPPPAELQRRESLVKPTWANISPGQVPSTTFDELVNNAINTGSAMQQDVGGGMIGGTEGETQSELGMLMAKNGLNQRQKKREVEMYDIFGKVSARDRKGSCLGWDVDRDSSNKDDSLQRISYFRKSDKEIMS